MTGQVALATLWTHPLLAGTQPGDNTGGQGPDFGKASPVALLVVVLLLIAVAFLVKSMTKHLRRVPKSFDGTDGTDDTEQADVAEDAEETDRPAEPDGITSPRKDTPAPG